MGYAEDLQNTRDALAKLGPKAVEILAKHLDGNRAQGDDMRLAAAQDILDRLEIRRSYGAAQR